MITTRAAAAEAGAAMATDDHAMPTNVAYFAEEINADDIEIDAEGIAGANDGDLADTYNKSKKRNYYRVVFDFRRIRYWKSFANTFAHEMLHVRYFRCGVKRGKHHTKEFYRQAWVTAEYLRMYSPTLQRFEAWLEYYSGDPEDLKVVEKAAQNALAGKSPPKR